MEKDKRHEKRPAHNAFIRASLAMLIVLAGCSSQQEVLYIIQACVDDNNNLTCDPDEAPVSDLIVTHRRGTLGILNKYLHTDTEGQAFIDARRGQTVSLELPVVQEVQIAGEAATVCSPGFNARLAGNGVVMVDVPIPANSCHPPGDQQSRVAHND